MTARVHPSGRSGAARPAAALVAAGVRPRKSKGQNFLVQEAVAERIVSTLKPGAGGEVVEIGPGLGILSRRLALSPIGRLRLIELDEKLAAGLCAMFAGDDRVTVDHRDFLRVDFAKLIRRPPVWVIGNLPFNVAGAILRRLCDYRGMIARMTLMFQREVAERIRAQPKAGSYGALSVFTALYWNVTEHFRVAAGSFYPRPKIDAEVLVFEPRKALKFAPEDERGVLETIRASFSAPRKTIRNALGHGLGLANQATVAALTRAGIDPSSRAERLGVEDFIRLACVLRESEAANAQADSDA